MTATFDPDIVKLNLSFHHKWLDKTHEITVQQAALDCEPGKKGRNMSCRNATLHLQAYIF
jgi:hypothetical protein